MKKIWLLISILLYPLSSVSVLSAPVSGINSFSYTENKDSKFLSGFQILIRRDHQENDFPKQIKTFLHKPKNSTDDHRHYSRTRSSNNTFDLNEVEAGFLFFDNFLIYGKAGFGKFESDLMILDETISGLYTSPSKFHVKDDSMVSFGGGLAFKMFEKEVNSIFKHLNAHLDFKYNKITIDAKKQGRNNLTYEADLDELQAGVVLTGSTDHIKVFLGPRVSSITGDEKLYIEKEDFLYEEKIKTSKNIGWIFGISFFAKDRYSLAIQKRIGDEEGVSFEAQIKF
ncbi:MAG: hypothetical protein RBR53_01100 [Desulforegulaceae bacterium]|nr:hypothetical protein [Desulforegulaceae bacterium]